MGERELLRSVFEDEALTRGLGDPEARVLVEWLVEQVEAQAGAPTARAQVLALRRRARAISRFVYLWSHQGAAAAAYQLAATERFPWPLPTGWLDPVDLMQHILVWESERLP
jgi:hypothetical protein